MKQSKKERYKLTLQIGMRLLLLIGCIVIVIFFLGMGEKSSGKPRDFTINMSIFSDGSSGISAFKKLLSSMGYAVYVISEQIPDKIDQQVFRHLTASKVYEKSVVVIADPHINSATENGAVALAEDGFTVLIFSQDEEFLKKVSQEELLKKNTGMDRSYVNKDTYGIYKQVEYFVTDTPFRFAHADSTPECIMADRNGGVVYEKEFGSGKVVVALFADLLSNDFIGKNDNVLFGYNLIRKYGDGSHVYFYEYIHGVHKKYTPLYMIADKRYAVIILFIVLLCLAAWLYSGQRFGQIKEERAEKEVKIRYYSEALGNILNKRRFNDQMTMLMIQAAEKLYGHDAVEEVLKNAANQRDIKNALLKIENGAKNGNKTD